MCDDHEHSAGPAWSAPRAAEGRAVDPVTLPVVDEVTVTTMVDNTFDALLAPASGVSRTPMGAGRVPAWQFAGGETAAGLRAEHGFSALVRVRSGETSTALLFDTGASPDALAVNAGRLGIDAGELQGVVLSHGHFDHAGGLDGLARLRGRSGLRPRRGGQHHPARHAADRRAPAARRHRRLPPQWPRIRAGHRADRRRAHRARAGADRPGHCTGWRAQHTLAAMLPDAWVQTSVGTTYTLSAA